MMFYYFKKDITMNTVVNIPPPVQVAYHMKMLTRDVPGMIHSIPATKKVIDKNSGTDVKFRRYLRMPVSKVPLGTSGFIPPSTNQAYVDMTAKLQMYAQWSGINEQVLIMNQDAVLNGVVDSLAISRRETEDELIRDMLNSTASRIDCVNGNNGLNPTEITRTDINTVYKALFLANGKSIMDEIGAEGKFGTAPVRKSYWAMGHGDLIGQIDQCTGFTQVINYPTNTQTLPDEFGACGGLRFLLSSKGSKSEGAASDGSDILNVFVTAYEGYGIIGQDGYSSKLVFRNAIHNDALALNYSVGWKMLNAMRIYNDKWVIKFCMSLA